MHKLTVLSVVLFTLGCMSPESFALMAPDAVAEASAPDAAPDAVAEASAPDAAPDAVAEASAPDAAPDAMEASAPDAAPDAMEASAPDATADELCARAANCAACAVLVTPLGRCGWCDEPRGCVPATTVGLVRGTCFDGFVPAGGVCAP